MGSFWLLVVPVQVTVVLLSGDTGSHAALACPLIANGASPSASINACRRRSSFGPATHVLARAPDVSPTLARANTLKMLKANLRANRFKYGRSLEGKLRCARQPAG